MSLLTTLLLILLPPLLITLIWFTALHVTSTTIPTTSTTMTLTSSRILILISHPDDEAMFFSPTLLSLTTSSLKNDIRLICLSSGNADGIGSIRKTEILHSCEILGIPCSTSQTSPSSIPQQPVVPKVYVLDHPSLPDSMTTLWDPSLIANEVHSVITSNWKNWSPDVIITFDKHGISGHTNHVSAWRGAKEYIRSSTTTFSSPSSIAPTRLFTLTTISLFRKYLSILDYPFTHYFQQNQKSKSIVFVSSPNEFSKARKAMTDAHKSQMRWFRWGWIWLSRYMVVNDLVEEEVSVTGNDNMDTGSLKGDKEL